MTSALNSLRIFLLLANISALVACGGGGGGAAAPTPTPTSESVLSGTAAIGAAAVGFQVQIRDRTGADACVTAPALTDENGAYRCQLRSAAQAPLAIVTLDPAGLVSPMVSLLPALPAAGATATANVTPLTTAIAAQAAGAGGSAALIEDPSRLASLDLAALALIRANVVLQLSSVLTSIGIDATSFDPFTTPFVGGSGAGADALLDQVRVSFDNGTPHLSNALNPEAPPVPLADAGTSSPPALTTSVVVGTFSMAELDFAKTELERCLAVPAATRAPAPDVPNRRLTTVAPECQGFVASIGLAPNVDVEFLNNGSRWRAYFYSLLGDDSMDGARFNRPELMRYITRTDGRDEAVLNIKFVDKSGFPGNRILSAKKFPGSRAEGDTQWWLIGNQRDTDASITTDIRRRDQTITDFETFQNAGGGRYDNGLRIAVRRGSLDVPNNPNAGIWYVRVRGPGLPTAGMVLADLPGVATSELMGFLRADGVIPAGLQQLAGAGATSVLRLQRTLGLESSAATTLRPNPGVTDALPSSLNFAHPTMYGAEPSSTWMLDVSGVVSWASYTFEAFDGSSTTAPARSWTARLVAPLVPVDRAGYLPWHGRGTRTTQFLTLGAPAVGTVTVDWINNPLAERVQTVWAQSYLNSSNTGNPTISDEVFSDFVTVPRGATSALVTADGAGAQWQSLVPPTTTSRIVTLQYQMLDGSRKQEQRFFN